MALSFDIRKKFGSFTLNAKGEFHHDRVGVFGDSGSGKTTLLNGLNGWMRPDAGYVKLQNTVLYSAEQKINVPVAQRRMGMVFQDALLFPHMSVQENIFYNWRYHPEDAHVKEVLDCLDLKRLFSRRPLSLSGGERQRVALARVFVRKPEILLMDEPVSSLDVKARQHILAYLLSLYERLTIPFVYVSHAIGEMMFLAQMILVLDDGQVIHYATPEQIFLTADAEHRRESLAIENMFDLPVTEFSADKGQGVLDFYGQSLTVIDMPEAPSGHVCVGIRAREILVAGERIEGLSARNWIKARLTRAFDRADVVVLSTDVGGHTCFVEVTHGAMKELNFQVGQDIYLVIKASSIEVLS